MIESIKYQDFGFLELLLIVIIIVPLIYFSISSVQDFALIEYHQIYGYPSFGDLERIEGSLVELGYCASSRGYKSSKAKIQTSKGIVSLITNCEIDKVAKKFFLKNEHIVAYKERLPSYILRSPNVVQLKVNDTEVLNYLELIEYQRSHNALIIIMGLVTLLFWIVTFWWGWRHFKKQFLNE